MTAGLCFKGATSRNVCATASMFAQRVKDPRFIEVGCCQHNEAQEGPQGQVSRIGIHSTSP